MKHRLALLIGTAVAFAAPLVHAGDDKAFREKLAKLIDRYSDDAGDDRLARALELCETHVKESQGDLEGHLELARLLLAKPDYEAAVAEAEKAAAIPNPEKAKCARSVQVLAMSLGMEGRVKKECDGKTDAEKNEFRKKLQGEARAIQENLIKDCGSADAAKVLSHMERARIDLYTNFAEIGKPPKEIGKKDTAGKEIDLASYKGKVVLVAFWAATDAASNSERDNLLKTYKEFHGKGLEAVGISLDVDKVKLDEYVKGNGISWRQYFDGKGWQNEVAVAWGVKGLPRIYLIDKDGKVRFVNVRGEALAPAVKELCDRPKKSK
jgi:peroxiredoxin